MLKRKNNIVLIKEKETPTETIKRLEREIKEKDEVIRMREHWLRKLTNENALIVKQNIEYERNQDAMANVVVYFANRKITLRDYIRGYFKKIF
jgi:hypothetical protein